MSKVKERGPLDKKGNVRGTSFKPAVPPQKQVAELMRSSFTKDRRLVCRKCGRDFRRDGWAFLHHLAIATGGLWCMPKTMIHRRVSQ